MYVYVIVCLIVDFSYHCCCSGVAPEFYWDTFDREDRYINIELPSWITSSVVMCCIMLKYIILIEDFSSFRALVAVNLTGITLNSYLSSVGPWRHSTLLKMLQIQTYS